MAEFILRAAEEQDLPAIRSLIHQVGINPLGLDWRRFVVAVDETGALLGCGQIKPHGKGIFELASIAVQPARRRGGIARAIIERLLEDAPRPLFLICRSGLGPFYAKWGFRALDPEEMPSYFRRLARLSALMPALARRGETLLVMKLDSQPPPPNTGRI